MITTLCLLGSYLLGAIPFGYLAVRLCTGLDIREHGSGNIGTTNVRRIGGWRLAIPVFALDVAKGLLPVLVATQLGAAGALGCPLQASLVRVGCALAAVVGHMASIFLRGRGGKGVATGLGCILGLAWQPALLGLGTWLLLVLSLRIVSVASCVAALVVTVSTWLYSPEPLGVDLPLCLLVSLVTLMVLWRHRSNFGRLRRGEEPRVLQRR